MGAGMAEFQPTFKVLRWKVDQASTFETQDDIKPLLDYDLNLVDLNDRARGRWGGEAAWGNGPRWGLGSPEGKLIQTWDREPTPQEVLSLMRSAGWTPFQERLEAFLREHPDQGEAQLALLRAMVPMLLRSLKEVPGGAGAAAASDGTPATQWTVDPALRAAFTDRLRKLMAVPGWVRQPGLRFVLNALLDNDDLAAAVLDADLRRDLREEAEEALRHTPSDPQLWALYANLCGPGDAPAAKALLMGLAAPPGEAWPPAAAAVPMGGILGAAKDWSGLEALASWAAGQVGLTPGARGSGLFARNPAGSWTALGLWAAWEQGRHDEVFRSLEAQLKEPSPGLMQALGRIRGSATEEERTRLADLFRGARGAFREAFRPAEPPPPLRLAKVGEPAWAAAFGKLSQAPAFDAWGGDELAWGGVDGDAAKALARTLGAAGWAALRGNEVLASGRDLPPPQALADQLRALAPPRLEAFGTFVKQHPEQEEARRARLGLLRSRMPHPRLEMQLLEEAKTLRSAFGAGEDWTPTPDLWRAPAKRLVPELELQLRRWPSEGATWEAWVEWSTLLQAPPDPSDLLKRLPIFRMREWMGVDAGPLPLEVASRVARKLKALGRWKDLEAWCRTFWDGGLRAELPDLLTPGSARFRQGLGEGALQRLGPALLQPWVEALEHTGAKAKAQLLRQDLDAVQPGLAKRLLEKSDAKDAPQGPRRRG
jgi:hypothetical protein